MEMIFTRLGEPNHEGLPTRKWSSGLARKMVQEEMAAGKGPTEAWENTTLKLGEAAPTLASVRKARQPGSKTVSTQHQLLMLLQRTLNVTVNENSRVPGYLQVRFLPFRSSLSALIQFCFWIKYCYLCNNVIKMDNIFLQ